MGTKSNRKNTFICVMVFLMVVICVVFFATLKLNNQKAVPKDDLELRYQQQAVVFDVDSLEMRDEPSADGNVIAYIPKGETVRIVQTGDDWHFVEYSEETGWCDARYLQLRTVKK